MLLASSIAPGSRSQFVLLGDPQSCMRVLSVTLPEIPHRCGIHPGDRVQLSQIPESVLVSETANPHCCSISMWCPHSTCDTLGACGHTTTVTYCERLLVAYVRCPCRYFPSFLSEDEICTCDSVPFLYMNRPRPFHKGVIQW